MVDETWRNEWLKLKSVEHKIKTLADARLKRCNHLAEPAQDVGRQAKRALFKSVLTCCCTSPVTRSVASMPCQLSCLTFSGLTFLDYKVGTRPEPCGFQVKKESCMLGNFLVNLGNFLYLLWGPGAWSLVTFTAKNKFSSQASCFILNASLSIILKVSAKSNGKNCYNNHMEQNHSKCRISFKTIATELQINYQK
jgi:hypothetical protein